MLKYSYEELLNTESARNLCERVLRQKKETLKSTYLFPVIPYNEGLIKAHLSNQLFPPGDDETEYYLSKLAEATSDVGAALRITDARMSGFLPALELDNGRLVFNIIGPNNPLHRIDGQEVDYKNDILFKKYIMACILSVPDHCESVVWDIVNKSFELYTQRDDFELVIILRKRIHGWEELASFEDFLKPFHPSCIVIYLDEFESGKFQSNEVVVVDPENRLVLHSRLSTIAAVGSAAFPLKQEDVSSLLTEYWHLNHSSLETLLGVEPSHKFFRKIPIPNPQTDDPEKEWRCVSDFQSKIVFLYTYRTGDRLALLHDTVKGLRERGVTEFEVITAYVPAYERYIPKQFLEVFSSFVAEHGLPWWVVPYDSSTYPRLKTLYAVNSRTDRLIVFDPKHGDGDPHGFEVINSYGPSTFPFTKKSLVEHFMKEVTQVITLQSLFEPVTRLHKEDPDPECDNQVCENIMSDKSSLLNGKIVLVYFDTRQTFVPVDEFFSWYNKEEKRLDNFEVVFVYLDTPKQDEYNVESRCQIPKWLISYDDEEKACAKYAVDNLFLKLFKRKFSTVVAFGKDGNICSLRADRVLSEDGAVTFPSNGADLLPEEIFNILNDYFTNLCSR